MTGLIKLKIDNNFIEDTDYREKIVIEFEKLANDNKHNLCIIRLPLGTTRYVFSIYGNKGFISTGSCKINNHNDEHFIHSFVYETIELYCISIQTFIDDDGPEEFVQFINNNIDNIDEKIKKIIPPKPSAPVPASAPDIIKMNNMAILDKFTTTKAPTPPPDSPPPTIIPANSVVAFNKRTGRKIYSVVTPYTSDDDWDVTDHATKKEVVEDDHDRPVQYGSDIKDIMNAIDLLHDDVFNTDVTQDDDVILKTETKDVTLL